MGEPTCLWKCEACGGWFDLGRILDDEQPLPVDVGSECSFPVPNIQQQLVWQKAQP
jgi:hypothetical protein